MTLVPAERGRLVFVSPRVELLPNTTHVITIDGAVDARGVRVAAASVTLTTW